MKLNRRGWLFGILGAMFFRPKPAVAAAVNASAQQTALDHAERNEIKYVILAFDQSLARPGGKWKRVVEKMASQNIEERVDQVLAFRKRKLTSS